jgi:hypothetical protein
MFTETLLLCRPAFVFPTRMYTSSNAISKRALRPGCDVFICRRRFFGIHSVRLVSPRNPRHPCTSGDASIRYIKRAHSADRHITLHRRRVPDGDGLTLLRIPGRSVRDLPHRRVGDDDIDILGSVHRIHRLLLLERHQAGLRPGNEREPELGTGAHVVITTSLWARATACKPTQSSG